VGTQTLLEPIRDLKRTRERILAAALAEFSAHGLAGARCNAIARRARVNQRMLFYCFGSKENLYREILHRKFTARTAQLATAVHENLAETIRAWYEAVARDQEWVRLLEWEALSTSPSEQLVGERERRDYLRSALKQLHGAQTSGKMPADLDLAQLHLSIIAMAVFPLAFPQMTRLATGLWPTHPRFRCRRLQFFRWLSERLASTGAPAPVPAGPQKQPPGKTRHTDGAGRLRVVGTTPVASKHQPRRADPRPARSQVGRHARH
jgi:AcrR family transcriptional regulator